MWKANEVVRKINDSSKNRVLRKLKKYANEDGFSSHSSNENEIVIKSDHFFWGSFKTRIHLEEEGDTVSLKEEEYAPQKLKYFLFLGSCLLFIPSVLLFFLQFTVGVYLMFVSAILWVIYYNFLGNTDPYEKDFGARFTGAEVVERKNNFFRIVLAELAFGLSPLILFSLIDFRSIGLVGYSILVMGILFLLLIYIALKLMRENDWFSHHFGIVLIGANLQIVSLWIPSIVLTIGSWEIPSFSSLFQVSMLAIFTIGVEWCLFSWILIALSRLDEDYLKENRAQIPLQSIQESNRGLIDKRLAAITFALQALLFLTPLALIIFTFGEIKSTLALLSNLGVPVVLLTLYLFLLLLPLSVMFIGTLINFYRKNKTRTELRKQASNKPSTEKEIFVRDFLEEQVEKLSFEEYGVIFSTSREIHCNAITWGLLKREAYIVISKGMLSNFSREEIKSFLYHEIYHLRNDSWWLAVLGNLSQFLFLGSGVLTAITDFSSREYLADMYASKKVGNRNFVEVLKKLRQEKVKRKFASHFPSLNFLGKKDRSHSDSWIGDIYWKVFGNYIPLYSHPSINERIEYLRESI